MRSPLPLLVLSVCAALSALAPGPCRGAPLLGEPCRRPPARITGALPGTQAYVYACDEAITDPAASPSGSLEHLLLGHLLERFLSGASSSSSLPDLEAVRRRGATVPKPYTVQHFRWGVKHGKKRRPMKGTAQGGGERAQADDGAEVPGQAQRRELQGNLGTPWDVYPLQQQQQQQQQWKGDLQQQQQQDQEGEGQEDLEVVEAEMRDFDHAEKKRYGGFMNPAEMCDKKTLLKFLRNVMVNER
ncbi:LOW QUALITY PROTEIN: pro-opiomelanocortin-like [Lethenteron reissneri]|uniref:LOW QUALITY PROTEIN: pro-opiomelanocortin-like n=1 Tax=Lethenteron reissneri TaxID=7753 RepID=UPI002AB6F054|nr:LOW QUALITY PROTEIN: pro-opiomelanocortin-like [Lethenteron reissneri]